MLATLVQSRTSTHISTLVHQFRPVSHAALVLISQQGLNLAVQDALWLSLAALIAVCFIRVQKPIPQEKTVISEQAVKL